jgi:hypothetical protein
VIKESLEVFNRLAADNPEYLLIVGCLLGNMSNYYEKIANDKTKMLENARKAYEILSSVERSGMGEPMYIMVKRMLGK